MLPPCRFLALDRRKKDDVASEDPLALPYALAFERFLCPRQWSRPVPLGAESPFMSLPAVNG